MAPASDVVRLHRLLGPGGSGPMPLGERETLQAALDIVNTYMGRTDAIGSHSDYVE